MNGLVSNIGADYLNATSGNLLPVCEVFGIRPNMTEFIPLFPSVEPIFIPLFEGMPEFKEIEI